MEYEFVPVQNPPRDLPLPADKSEKFVGSGCFRRYRPRTVYEYGVECRDKLRPNIYQR